MKRILLLLAWFPFMVNAQDIARSEAEIQQHLISFQANSLTQNYDLIYHRLEFAVDPAERFIAGKVTTYFKAKEEMDQVVFDLKDNLAVSHVKHLGEELNFIQEEDNLIINLPGVLAEGALDSLNITYSGTPAEGGLGYFEQSEHNGSEILWTLSEPYGAQYWWPCKQDLTDKVDSLDVYIKFPTLNQQGEENVGVSNGKQLAKQLEGAYTITHFKHSYPIPAYLIAIAVSNYEIYSQTVENNGNSFELINYIYPEDVAEVQSKVQETPELIDFFSETFGEYPYADEKYAHCQFGWGGGMEHTTISFMGSFSLHLIAHELAHQWFGNKVTAKGWQNIWVSEGFAEFLHALSLEHIEGAEAYKDWRVDKVHRITQQPGGTVYVPEEDTLSVDRVFDQRLSYDKGSMIVHMLRRKVGDGDFFQGLRNYLNDPELAYAFASIDDVRQALENEAGLDLKEFFNQWIYGEGYPTYALKWQQIDNQEVSLQLSQETSVPESVSFFKNEVPIRLIGSEGEVLDTSLTPQTNHEEFIIPTNFTVDTILIDPETEIISGDNSVLGMEKGNHIALKIYPNPASSILYFDMADYKDIKEAKVYDINGRLIREVSNQNYIDLSGMPSGYYFLKVENQAKKSFTKSFIKK